MKRLLALWLVLTMGAFFAGCTPEEPEEQYEAKPVLYLYPQEQTEVRVKLDYDGELLCTWPKSDGSWTVLAQPDGTLTDEAGETYSYLFWEGKDSIAYDFSRGFVVRGEETGTFLRRTLSAMGLTPREYNEFIVYWLPQMEGNAYNLLAFQQEAYTAHAALSIEPEPDSVLRVFLAWKPLEAFQEIAPQDIVPFERKGFAAVEWGGAKVE